MITTLKQLHPIIHTLFVGTFLSRIANSMSLPFLAIYLSKQTDLSPVTIGIIVGVAPLASTFSGVIGGILSDRFGRKVIMLSSIYTWGFVFIGFALVQHPILFFLLSALNGICKAFFEPVSQALMGDLTEKKLRAKVFSIRYTVVNMGVAIGPLLGVLFGMSANGVGFMLTGGFYILYSITLHLFFQNIQLPGTEIQKEQGPPILDSLRILQKDKVLLYFIIGAAITQIGYAQFAPLSHHMSTSFEKGVLYFGWMMTTNAIVVVIAQIPLSSLFEKFSTITGVYVGNSLYAIGGLGFAFSNNLTEMILSMVVFTLGEILCFPAGTILIDQLAPNHLRGCYYGAQNFTELGKFLGPTLGMFIYSSLTIHYLFIIIACLLIISNYIYWLGSRLWSRIQQVIAQELMNF